MSDSDDAGGRDPAEGTRATDGGMSAGSDATGRPAAGDARVARLRQEIRVLERRNERLASAAKTIAHDIRSPLMLASNHAELARTEQAAEHFEAIDRAHDRIEALLERLDAAAAGDRAGVEPGPVDLAARVEAAWRGLDHGAASLVVETDATIVADRSRLTRLLENLLRNAVEHGSPGSRPSADTTVDPTHGGSTPTRAPAPRLVAETHDWGTGRSEGTRGDDGPRAGDLTVTVGDVDGGFYVADDGPGVPAGERDRVFEEGYTTADTGSGLGLSIVRDVVRDHGWELGLTESDAGGARFEISGVRQWPGV